MWPAETWGRQNMGRAEGARSERRPLKTERPLTCLQWGSDRPIDSVSAWEIPILLKALASMVPRQARCEVGAPAQRGEKYSIKLKMKAL